MKLPYIVVILLASITPAVSQVSITGFGSGQFTYDSNFSNTQSISQTASNFTVRMLDQGGSLFGSVPTVSIIGSTALLSLTAIVTENPGTSFTLELYDNSQLATYTGNWANFTTGASSTATLQFASAPAGFNYANITGVFLNTGGASGPSVTATLDQLTAIPEPSTYAAILGLVCIGAAIVKRRQRAEALSV
jgi:hypothetical protein